MKKVMSAISSSPNRRTFLATSTAVGAFGLLPVPLPAAGDGIPSRLSIQGESQMAKTEANALRPFRIHVPEEALADLRRRIGATRWPDRETVTDLSQGAQLAKIQELVRYWGTDYNWRKVEARLNALPQLVTEI